MTEAYLPCLAVASGTGVIQGGLVTRGSSPGEKLHGMLMMVIQVCPLTKTYLFPKNGYILLYVNLCFPQS